METNHITDEVEVVRAMLGRRVPSILMSDGYKFSMAQAGFALREETFYLSFRRPGWYFMPFDLGALVRELCPPTVIEEDSTFLQQHGYDLTSAMRNALGAAPLVQAAAKGSWVREREPIVTVTAPSFLASWLESLAIWLQYPIQVATEALLSGRRDFVCTCEDEASIVSLTLRAVGVTKASVTVDAAGYRSRVERNARALVACLGGQHDRLFEVGMRGATCMAMHEQALRACREVGLSQTSNVFLAHRLGMTPVGTTGHEHQQRWGNDLEAFRAIRDMRTQAPSYLFDTYDAEGIGVPAAIAAMREDPVRTCSVRFDSGDQLEQLRSFVAAGVEPSYVFMDSVDADKARLLESGAAALGIPRRRRLYGSGGFLVARAAACDLTRDRVAAVYKLCQSGSRPVMKFGVASKSSVPGRPVILRRTGTTGALGLIAQQGEAAPAGYAPLTVHHRADSPPSDAAVQAVALSPATERIVRALRRHHFGEVGDRAAVRRASERCAATSEASDEQKCRLGHVTDRVRGQAAHSTEGTQP